MSVITIAVHGGAGTILKKNMTPEMEKEYLQALSDALYAGFDLLRNGGPAMDAVTAAVVSLEDCILFNAGRGSVFTNTGTHEMDAAIMDGNSVDAGAVTCVRNIRNPVMLAREVLQKSEHVLLCGSGAEEFARQHHIKTEPDEYFFSEFRHRQWLKAKEEDQTALDHNIDPSAIKEKKFGTVGAVACDAAGNIAAATSTGGMTNKKFGRIGDSPVIGAGTYANNKTCAVSCTGHGEPFMKAVTAYDVSCLMEYKGYSLQQAMEEVTLKKLVAIDGEGGMIGVDAKGNAALVFNCSGMYRGVMNNKGLLETAIYR